MSMKDDVVRILNEVVAEEGGNKSAAAIRLGANVVTFWDWVSVKEKRRTDALFDALDAAGARIIRDAGGNRRDATSNHVHGIGTVNGSLSVGNTQSGASGSLGDVSALKEELAAVRAELEAERGRREFAERMAMSMMETLKGSRQ